MKELLHFVTATSITFLGVSEVPQDQPQQEEIRPNIVAAMQHPSYVDIVTFDGQNDPVVRQPKLQEETPYHPKSTKETANKQGVRQKGYLQLKVK